MWTLDTMYWLTTPTDESVISQYESTLPSDKERELLASGKNYSAFAPSEKHQARMQYTEKLKHNLPPAHVTNDIEPKTPAQFHMDALEFLQTQYDQRQLFDGVIYYPPYSQEMYEEHYKSKTAQGGR